MTTIRPEDVGFSAGRLQRLAPVMQKYVEQQVCAGGVTLIARHGQIAQCECFGMLDIETRTPMRPDAIFRIYSMSKPITTTALMLLYEEGALRLADPVSKFIPEFSGPMVCVGKAEAGLCTTDCDRGMTVHDLLTHTSGLSYGFDDAEPVDQRYRDVFGGLNLYNDATHMVNPDGPTLQTMVSALAGIPLRYQPGSQWVYSFSIDVAGYLVELLSGEPLDQFLRRRIFAPLQMPDTGFTISETQRERLAAMYTPGKTGGLEVLDRAATTSLVRPHNFFSGGGGLVSTASDYFRFAQMLLNQGELDGVRLLGRKTVEFMLRNHLTDTVLRDSFAPLHPGFGFGLGGKVVLDAAQSRVLGSDGAFGWGGAARTDFWIDPQEDLIGLFMIQLFGGNTRWLADDFRVLTYQALVD